MAAVSAGQQIIIFTGVLCVLLLGVVVTTVGVLGYQSESLAEADKLIKVNTSNNDGIEVDITKTFMVIVIAGVVTILGAFVGCLGVCSKNRVCLSLFTLVTVLFGTFFIFSGVYLMAMMASVAPSLQKTVQDTCRDDVYPALMQELKCTSPKPPPFAAYQTAPRILSVVNDVMDFFAFDSLFSPASESDEHRRVLREVETTTLTCGPLCQQRADKLKATGEHACDLLNFMCGSTTSTVVGEGNCLVSGGAKPTTTWITNDSNRMMARRDCKHFCVTDIGCTAYSFGESTRICITVSPNEPAASTDTASTMVWKKRSNLSGKPVYDPITETDGVLGLTCYFKACHRLVRRLLDHGRNAAFAAALLGGFLIISFLCACRFIFTISTRSAKSHALFSKIFCGLCPRHRKKKYNSEKGTLLLTRDVSDTDEYFDSSGDDESDTGAME